jgi:enediyne biosynthesis protein E4
MDSKRLKPVQPSPPAEEEIEEYVREDDSVIGRAFFWSTTGILGVLLAGGGFLFFLNKEKPAAAPTITALAAPAPREFASVEIPFVQFTDVTREAGISFVHNNGAYGDKLLPETMGGGVAFFDFDNDGHQDLLLVNSADWPWAPEDKRRAGAPALYRNDGTGRFIDVTEGSGLDIEIYGMGVAVGDYDNDGYVDVFITAVGSNKLFRNLGDGKFEDVTEQAGVGGAANEWGVSAAFIDYNNDGKLDLFVCNYVRWSREIDFEVGYTLTGVGRAYGPPMNFEGTFPYLYRNEGNGRFSDVTAEAGLQIRNPASGVPKAKSLGVAPVDLDGDGWIDLIVANDTVQNFVFHNQRDGTFREIGALTGVAFDSYGNTRGAMGIDTGHFRNDEALGIAIGNFSNEMTALYVSQGSPLIFTDEAIAEGIGPSSRLLLTFGVFFFDYDLDGRLDLLAANGHIEDEINKVQQSQHFEQPAQLFWNAGMNHPSSFIPLDASSAGSDLFTPIVGRGSAFADIDGDGDLDVILTQIGGPPILLRNDQNLGHNWLRFKLVGAQSNRDAIGAWVLATVDGQVIRRQVMPTRGYLSQSELPVTIGLGEATQIERLQVIWPGGKKQEIPVEHLALNQLHVVTEAVH